MTNIKPARKVTEANQSSEKLLTLIELLSTWSEPVKLQSLASQASMNVSTTLRFLMALENKGYVVQDDTGRYSLTYKLCGIANNIKMHTSIRNICLPFMKEVSRYFGETVNLSEEENMSVVYLEVIQCERQALCTTQRIGKVAPLYCTGVGKLFMLNHPWEKLCDYYEKNKPVKYTENTCTTMEEIFNKMETARECGYSTDDEECEMGMRCVAVPIRNYTGEIIAGLSVSGPTTRMTLENIQEVLDLGVYRAIIGTKAVENPDFIRQAIDRFGAEHIVVGIDAKDGYVAVEGWEKLSDKTAVNMALAMKEMGVQTIVYTDISKDGMLAGPNIEQTKILSDKTGIDIIASGGVSCMEDLEAVSDAGIHGAIIGKALYEKRVVLKEAVEKFEK